MRKGATARIDPSSRCPQRGPSSTDRPRLRLPLGASLSLASMLLASACSFCFGECAFQPPPHSSSGAHLSRSTSPRRRLGPPARIVVETNVGARRILAAADDVDDGGATGIVEGKSSRGSSIGIVLDGDDDISDDATRRQFLAAFSAAALAATALPSASSAATTTAAAPGASPLEEIDLGVGRWVPKKAPRYDDSSLSKLTTPELLTDERIVPAPFAAYATRFLLTYDAGMSSWWTDQCRRYSLLSETDRSERLGRSFGCLATSVRNALVRYVVDGADYSGGLEKGVRNRFGDAADLFRDRYGKKDDEARRQIGLLFAMLPGAYQPEGAFARGSGGARPAGADALRDVKPVDAAKSSTDDDVFEYTTEEELYAESRVPQSMLDDLSALLPPEYRAKYDPSSKRHTIVPRVGLYSIGVDDEYGQNAVATPFGPVSSAPLRRDVPDPSAFTYALFGLSGGAGCALTHSLVIPLDVVKTRLQTDPDAYDGIADGAVTIWKEEGPAALLLGAQATVAGYLWYGLSVYPSYSWFKNVIGTVLLTPDVAVAHANDVAIAAGALSAVLASIGLTPLEAARIRTVAEPDTYRDGGLINALRTIATENEGEGAGAAFRSLYAGFPSLVTRQVVFGSIKFLSFERACAAIYAAWPFLRDATATSLAVSLVAGGMAGALSSVVSQPADSVLTYIAQREGRTAGGKGGGQDGKGGGGGGVGMGLLEGCRLLVEEDGPGALFRGLGSRCLWAGSIIAGQFFLYDIFRTAFHVNADDLTQVFEVIIR